MTEANTIKAMEWIDRLTKDGWCGCVPIESLAEYMGESGNENVSDAAIEQAKEWERDPSKMIEFIRTHRQRWCMAPTWGCYKYCEKWKDPVWKEAEDE